MTDGWTCPVCGARTAMPRWRVTSTAVENGVDPQAFRPNADRYGETVATVVRCMGCGHGSLAATPNAAELAAAYDEAAAPDTLSEEPGQLATADRGLDRIEALVSRGRLVDLGCWTGSFMLAAHRRGWQAVGVEPSRWAVEQARARGLDARLGDLYDHRLPLGEWQCVVMCDVLEHLLDPAAAVATARELLAPGGVLYVTVPDAGSRVARAMGPRWWSVLPMHVQYFTRSSMRRLVEGQGLRVVGVRSHPKVFTWSYYAQRLEGYSPGLARAVLRTVRTAGLAGRPVAPDLHHQMQVLAVRP